MNNGMDLKSPSHLFIRYEAEEAKNQMLFP